MRHKLAALLLIVAVLLTTVSGASAQSSINSTQGSEREQYVSKVELAVQEVIKSREYINELETNLKATEDQVAEMEKAGAVTAAELESKKTEATELRESIKALKAANAERVKEIGKMQKKINRLESQVKFWRKVAGIASLAAGAAAVVLLR